MALDVALSRSFPHGGLPPPPPLHAPLPTDAMPLPAPLPGQPPLIPGLTAAGRMAQGDPIPPRWASGVSGVVVSSEGGGEAERRPVCISVCR